VLGAFGDARVGYELLQLFEAGDRPRQHPVRKLHLHGGPELPQTRILCVPVMSVRGQDDRRTFRGSTGR
jgi:hypothetical protein